MAEQVQGTALSQEQLLQFQIINNAADPVPNIPFLTPNVSFNATTQYQWQLPANLNSNITVPAVVTTLLIPTLQVDVPVTVDTPTGLTYSQVQESITTNNYETNFIFAQSSNCNQVGQVFTYNQVDVSGNATVNSLPFTIDPYQAQCAAYFYPPEHSVIFSGESSLNFTMLPETTMNLKVFSSSASAALIQDEISGFKSNTFVQVEKDLGSDIFTDYCNYLIDHE